MLVSADDWSVLARACHVGPLALSSSGSSRHWSRFRRLASAGSALRALGPFLSALVTRTGWLSARPAARATGLALPAGLRWFSASRSWSFLESACHADRLALGSSCSSRHWPRSAGWSPLVLRLRAPLSLLAAYAARLSRAGLPRPLPGDTARSPRARILLEFGCSRQFHTRGCTVFTVPRVR